MSKYKISFLNILFIILLLYMSCNGDIEQVPEPEEEKTVKSVGGLVPGKQKYRPYETFSTSEDELRIFYTDGTSEFIVSGFTHEWIRHPPGTWWCEAPNCYDPDCTGEYAPIKDGDPLPVHVTSTSPMMTFEFYVRGVYKGVAGTEGFRSVSWGY